MIVTLMMTMTTMMMIMIFYFVYDTIIVLGIDCTYMIKIMIAMTMIMTIIIKLNKKGYDNKNNTTKQKDNTIAIKQLHITKLSQ